jgi:hypothetical protein
MWDVSLLDYKPFHCWIFFSFQGLKNPSTERRSSPEECIHSFAHSLAFTRNTSSCRSPQTPPPPTATDVQWHRTLGLHAVPSPFCHSGGRNSASPWEAPSFLWVWQFRGEHSWALWSDSWYKAQSSPCQLRHSGRRNRGSPWCPDRWSTLLNRQLNKCCLRNAAWSSSAT